jgi:ribonuclease G
MANNSILINVGIGETRVALIEEGIIRELYIERTHDESPVGNIYLGKVTRVLPGMQAAFVEIGLERAAFLHVEDVIPTGGIDHVLATEHDEPDLRNREDLQKEEEDAHDEAHAPYKPQRLTRSTPIRDVLKEGDSICVQVAKEPISTKGARVTGHISLPGRYVVYMPTLDQVGVSKRIGNDKERRRLREAIDTMKPPEGGVIVRTVAAGLTKKKLKTDIGYLMSVWNNVQKERDRIKGGPSILYSELDLVCRAARDLFTDNIQKLVIDDPKQHGRLVSFIQSFMPERVNAIELYKGQDPIFDEYGIEDEISRALSRKVPLPSGGYLIIDQAEALTAIDVNTGRFTGKGKDVEETIFQTNLEAVREIAYQLRFRNIGGLIVVDFIDMERPSHRDKVYKAFNEVLRNDRAKTTTVRISELGLVEMTRKRTRDSLGRTLYEPCFYCDGTGYLQSRITVCHEILRQISREKTSLPGYKIIVNAHPAVVDRMQREEKEALELACNLYARQIVLQARSDYHLEQFDLNGA